MAVDPKENLAADMTPYHYTHNNPINRLDPDGNSDFGLTVMSSAMRVEYNKAKNSVGRFAEFVMYKYTPKVLDFTASVTGYASLKFPILAPISFTAKIGSAKWKMNNLYYTNQDAYGDYAGAVVGLANPIVGEMTDIAVDNWSTTTKKVNPAYKIHSGPANSSANDSNQKNENNNQNGENNQTELTPIPSHETKSAYTDTMRDLLGITD